MGWSGRAPAPASEPNWQGAPKTKEHAMSEKLNSKIAVIGIDIGKNSFHIVGQRSAWSLGAAPEVGAWPSGSAAMYEFLHRVVSGSRYQPLWPTGLPNCDGKPFRKSSPPLSLPTSAVYRSAASRSLSLRIAVLLVSIGEN